MAPRKVVSPHELTDEQIAERWVGIAVKGLREFGYESVDSTNIFTDEVYSLFFRRNLIDGMGRVEASDLGGERVTRIIKGLLAKIDDAQAANVVKP